MLMNIFFAAIAAASLPSLLLLSLRDEIRDRRFDNYLRYDPDAWVNAYSPEHSQTTVLLNGHAATVDIELAQTLVNMSCCSLALDVHTWASCKGNPEPMGSNGYIAFASKSGKDMDAFKAFLFDALCQDLGYDAPHSSPSRSRDHAFSFTEARRIISGRRQLVLYWNHDAVPLYEIELLSIHLVARCAVFSRRQLEAMTIRDINSSGRPLSTSPRLNRVASVITASVKAMTRRPAVENNMARPEASSHAR